MARWVSFTLSDDARKEVRDKFEWDGQKLVRASSEFRRGDFCHPKVNGNSCFKKKKCLGRHHFEFTYCDLEKDALEGSGFLNPCLWLEKREQP
jgi:hypothetical protein